MKKNSGKRQLCFGARTSRMISIYNKPPTDMPDPFKYTPDINVPKTFKPSAKPFGIGAQRQPPPKFLTPAPGTYIQRERKVRVCTKFGHDRMTFPYVHICCNQFNRAFCWKCKTPAIGDYWHKKKTNLFLCRRCMEPKQKKFCKTHAEEKELAKYVLTRHCGFYHTHPDTKAAVQHMPAKYLKFKIQRENYLSSFGL